MDQLGSHWKEKIKLLLKSEKKAGILRQDLCTFIIQLAEVFLRRMRNVSVKGEQEIKTHILR
jgi:hypothetical protein